VLPRLSASRCFFSSQVRRSFEAPCSAPIGRRVPRGSSWPLSSCREVRKVHAPSSLSRIRPHPRPTAVSNSNHAVTTPSSSVGGSVVRKPEGRVESRVWRSRSATPSGFSTVVMFQVKETRSRQNEVGANISLARSTSPAVRASSKAANQASTRDCGSVASVVVGSRVWVMDAPLTSL
jgi:hypothetical protein